MKKSKKKTSVIPRLELVIIAVFFLSFLMWATTKCRVTQEKYAHNQLSIVHPPETETVQNQFVPNPSADSSRQSSPKLLAQNRSNPFQGISRDSLASIYNAIAQGADPASFIHGTSPKFKQKVIVVDSVVERTKLYVVIEGLNFRMAPSLESPAILRLPKGHELQFMDEVSPFTQEINMGDYIANEPWVKVKHWKGQIGWVYGAGVHYFIPPDSSAVISLTTN